MIAKDSDERVWVRDQMLDASVDCVKLIDTDGAILHMNRPGCEALGVTAEQAGSGFGMMWLELLSPEVRSRGRRALRRAVAGKVARFAGRSSGGGSVQEWDNILTPLTDPAGVVTAVLCVSRDVTDQRRAEERLRAARDLAERARLQLALLHDVADGANQAATLSEGLELVAEALMRRAGWEVLAVPADLDDRVSALATRVRDRGAPDLLSEADGSRVYGMPLLVEGQVAEVLLVRVPGGGDDVAGTLRRMAQQLSRLLERERTGAALARARDDALAAARSKTEFLAVMSHELRTPMNGVIGLGEVLLHSPLDAHQRRVAEAMQDAGRTLTGIVGDVLELTRLESDRVELRNEEFDVRRVVQSAARLCAPQAALKSLELVVDLDPTLPQRLRGDGGRLGQIVTNLCANAVKFTDSGEVRLEIAGEPLEDDGVLLAIRVVDSGPGVDADYVGKLFEPFVQENASIGSQDGSGLGLAITRELAEAMGGRVELAKTGPHGSVFLAEIPFGLVPGGGARSDVLRGERILVAEHRGSSRAAVVRTLTGWGAEVAVASSSDELRDMSRGAGWAAVLVASGLPGMDLEDLVGRMALPDAIVVVPGFGSEADIRARELGLRTLVSPVSGSELEALVRMRETEPVDEASTVPPLSWLRVLVVDDDTTNQMVASGLLGTLGCAVVTVDDGAAAVRWIGLHPDQADVVLMDCRMPVMDGYDATRELRRAGVTIPIIGCTAETGDPVRERCLAAGMTDVVAKPLRRAALARALADSGARNVDAPVSLLPLVDEDRVAELRSVGDDVFEYTRSVFLSRLRQRLDEVAAPEAEGSEQRLRAVHSLVGAAANIGLPRLAAAARQLEDLLGSEGPTTLLPALEELRAISQLSASALGDL